MNSNLLNYDKAAAFLGVSHWTIRKYVAQRRIPYVQINKRVIRFRPSDLERFAARLVEDAA